MEPHVQIRVGLDQVLELLDDGVDIMQRFALDLDDALLEPIVENFVVLGQPPTTTMLNQIRGHGGRN